jgi:hypothetical protein
MIRRLFSLSRSNTQKEPKWFPKRLFDQLIVAAVAGAMLLASCSPSPAAVATPLVPVTGPTATVPSPFPTATAALPPVPADTATLTPVPTIQTYLVKPDDLAQARLRIGNCIFNGPAVDIYINGQMTDNGGVPFKLRAFDFSGYLYLPPGTVKLAVTPQGAGLDKALFGPLDLSLEAGHRYTVALLGLAGDTQPNSQVIDETKVIQNAGATNDQYTYTLINNIKGVETFDHVINGNVNNSKIAYGGYQAEVLPALPLNSDVISLSGAPDKILDPGGPTTGPEEGSTDSLACYAGKYPGSLGSDFGYTQSAEYTNLSLLDYLKHYTDQNQALKDPSNSFSTFLALVKTAGMTDVLNNSPHFVFVPSDSAFSYVPKPKLDALLADPKAAQAFLREHIVEGYYPYGSLSGGGGASNRTLTNLSGTSLNLLGDPMTINGKSIDGDLAIITANGSRFQSITTVMPGSE